jgi:hypothetical protein
VAWISTDASTATARMTAGLPGPLGGFVRVDDRLVATTLTDLITSFRIFNPIRMTELGEELDLTRQVWTATNPNGTARTAGDCGNWTTTSGFGDCGTTHGGPGIWTYDGSCGCDVPHRIICLQRTILTAAPAPSAPTGKIAYYTANNFASGGGLASAHAFCNANKPAAYSTRTFRALLATTTATAGANLDLSANYFRADGTFVGTGADIADGGDLISGFWQRNDGVYSTNQITPWSGAFNIALTGTMATTCNNYMDNTTTSPSAKFSHANWTYAGWFGWFGFGCTITQPLICVEQ